MFRVAWYLGGGIHALLQPAPTNALLRRLQTRRGLKWSLPAMLLGVGYIYAAAVCTTIIDHGGPAWLNALVLLFIWNGFKFLLNGPFSLITLIRVWIAERRWARRGRVDAVGQGSSSSPPRGKQARVWRLA